MKIVRIVRLKIDDTVKGYVGSDIQINRMRKSTLNKKTTRANRIIGYGPGIDYPNGCLKINVQFSY